MGLDGRLDLATTIPRSWGREGPLGSSHLKEPSDLRECVGRFGPNGWKGGVMR